MKKSSIYLTLLLLFVINSFKTVAQTEVTFYTNMGDFKVMLYDSIVPITAGNCISLVEDKYYDGVIFHRVIDNFMIQGGDPTGTGMGGPGYTIPDEFDSTLSNIQKTISMANAGPNTGGSQFFINLVHNTYLDFDKAPYEYAHPVFGIVVENFSVVQAIGNVPVNGSNRPNNDVVMDSVRITKAYLGVNELLDHSKAYVYPNPINYQSQCFVKSDKASKAIIQLIDMNGAVVYSFQTTINAGNNSISLAELTKKQFASGVYLLNIKSENSLFHSKIWMP